MYNKALCGILVDMGCLQGDKICFCFVDRLKLFWSSSSEVSSRDQYAQSAGFEASNNLTAMRLVKYAMLLLVVMTSNKDRPSKKKIVPNSYTYPHRGSQRRYI